jgi:hypothetical protein
VSISTGRRTCCSQLRVQYQSTLVVFKGNKEVARSTAATSEAAIAAQLARAL